MSNYKKTSLVMEINNLKYQANMERFGEFLIYGITKE